MLTRPHIERDDAGMTLVELVVGMMLLSLVSTFALNFFIGSEREANRVTEQDLNAGSARAVLAQLARTLQVADSFTARPGDSTGRFTVIGPTEVTFYSNYTATSRSSTASRSAPTKVDFTLINGTLWESTYAPKGSAPAAYPTTPTSRNALLSGVTNVPVFTYCSSVTDPSTICTTTTDPASVALVQVTLTVKGLPGTTPQTVQSAIAITGAVS